LITYLEGQGQWDLWGLVGPWDQGQCMDLCLEDQCQGDL